MKKSFARKITSVFLVAIFAFNIFVGDYVYASSSQTKNPLNAEAVKSQDQIDISGVSIPPSMGHIDSVHTGSSGKTVFHIKDAHCNYDAQKSIYKIIDWIVNNYGVSSIHMEGGSGAYNLGAFEDINTAGVKEHISDDYLKNGMLNGAELYRIFNPDRVELVGIENMDLYDENLDAYKKVLSRKNEIDEFLVNAEISLGKIKENIDNAHLKTFIANRMLFESDEMDVKNYTSYLIRSADEFLVNVEDCLNINIMSGLFSDEGDIDFERANNEREALIKDLSKSLSRYEREIFVMRVAALKKKEITEYQFCDFLIRNIKIVGLEERKYSEFLKYAQYTLTCQTINTLQLFDEIEKIEKRLEKAMCRSGKDQELLRGIAQVCLLKKLFCLQIDKKEIDIAKKTIDIPQLLLFVKQYGGSRDDFLKLCDNATYVSRAFSDMLSFYSITGKRDKVFVENILDGMVESNARATIVFTGGFHSDNLSALLKDEEVSYVSITPSFMNAPHYESPYMELLTQDWLSYGRSPKLVPSSTIQIKSPWSKAAIDADFLKTLIFRINAVFTAKAAEQASTLVLKLGRTKLLLLRGQGFEAIPNLPVIENAQSEYNIVDVSGVAKMTSRLCYTRLKESFEAATDEIYADLASGDTYDVKSMLKQIVDINGNRAAPIERITLLRTPDARILVKKHHAGIGDVDEFRYVYKIESEQENSELTCTFSHSRDISRYMITPSVVLGRHEKAYLFDVLNKLYAPGVQEEGRRKMLQVLLDEQNGLKSNGECGWAWEIDQDADGKVILDEKNGYGLHGLYFYDRRKMPRGYHPKNLQSDASKYGGDEKVVQEMKFDIKFLGTKKIEVLLSNTWGAKQREGDIQARLNQDPLTGIPNRGFYLKYVKDHIPVHLPTTILFIDADHFKQVNDELSHYIGDEVLIKIAHTMRDSIRETDAAIRWGGEEFMVVLPETSAEDAKKIAMKILKAIKKLKLINILKDMEKRRKLTAAPAKLIKKLPGYNISVTIGATTILPGTPLEEIEEAWKKADYRMNLLKHREKRGAITFTDDGTIVGEEETTASQTRVEAVTPEVVKKDINKLLGRDVVKLLLNLTRLVENDRRHRQSLITVLDTLREEKFQGRLQSLRKYLPDTVVISSEELPVITEELSRIYDKIDEIRAQIHYPLKDDRETKDITDIMASMKSISDTLFKYRTKRRSRGVRAFTKRQYDVIDRVTCKDDSGFSIFLPWFKDLTFARRGSKAEELLFFNMWPDINSLLIAFLNRVEQIFRKDLNNSIRGASGQALKKDAFLTIAKVIMSSFNADGGVSSGNDAIRLRMYLRSFENWVAKIMVRYARNSEDDRIIVYPVYSRAALQEEMKMIDAVKDRLENGDYGFKIRAVPYYAGDTEEGTIGEFYAKLLRDIPELLGGANQGAKAIVYTDKAFFTNEGAIKDLQERYSGRVVQILEEGVSSEFAEFTHLSFHLRTALSIAVLDYFDEDIDSDPYHKERLRDMIATMLAVITKDMDIVKRFEERPEELINGNLVLHPAECISLDELERKDEMTQLFLKSL